MPRTCAVRKGSLLQRYQGLLFAAPALLALAGLIGYPLVDTAVLSFTTETGSFAGLSNYSEMLSDDVTALSTYNSIIYVGASIVLQLVLGSDRRHSRQPALHRSRAARTLILVPWIVPGIVAATTWAWMFHVEFGIIDYALQSAHIISEPVGWLLTPNLVLPSVIAVNVWKMFPFVGIMVLAGLQAIPHELFEAARVDGASNLVTRSGLIILPQIRTVLLSVALLLVIWGMNGITIIYAMTGGRPANQSLILPIQIFKQAFESFQFNQAAALSLVLFGVLFAFILVYMIVFQPGKGPSDA